MNTEIKSVPFSWNDNFSEVALEDFQQIQKDLPYLTCQSIGMALAKLEMLEKQGCKVGESRWISCGERQPKEYKAESEDKE
jgi:hypothetical protein